ncbi:hypothetical protein MPDQ_004184, partial [Monascus purpureus]
LQLTIDDRLFWNIAYAGSKGARSTIRGDCRIKSTYPGIVTSSDNNPTLGTTSEIEITPAGSIRGARSPHILPEAPEFETASVYENTVAMLFYSIALFIRTLIMIILVDCRHAAMCDWMDAASHIQKYTKRRLMSNES